MWIFLLQVLGAIQQCMKNNEVINGCVFVDKWPSFNVVVFEKYQKYAQRVSSQSGSVFGRERL